MNVTLSTLPPDVLLRLEAKLKSMTENMVLGNKLGVSRVYADNALLTNLKESRVEGREAIDRHWAELPPYQTWQLNVLETGGDIDTPHQRLHSLARFDFKGKVYIDEGYCFVIWKKQTDGDYLIYVDIYHPLRFGAE